MTPRDTLAGLSPAALVSLIATVGLTVGDLFDRTSERLGTAGDATSPEEYEAAMRELDAAGLIRYFPGENGEEGNALPGGAGFQAVFELFVQDVERLAAEQGKAFEGGL